MKRLLLVALLAVFGVLVYATCTDKPPKIQQVEKSFERTDPNVGGLLLDKDEWRIVLSGKDWKLTKPDNQQIVLMAIDNERKQMVLLIKEPTTATFEEYVVGTVKSMNMVGASLVSAGMDALNNEPFFLVATTTPTMQAWITVKNGFGYVLSCGGEPEDTEQFTQRCQEIANTFQIKD